MRSEVTGVEMSHLLFLCQGPGLFFVVPCIDNFQSVDMRTVSFGKLKIKKKYLGNKRILIAL